MKATIMTLFIEIHIHIHEESRTIWNCPKGLHREGEWATTLSLQVPRAASGLIHTPRRNFAPISSSIRKHYRVSARTRGTARSRRVGANIVRI